MILSLHNTANPVNVLLYTIVSIISFFEQNILDSYVAGSLPVPYSPFFHEGESKSNVRMKFKKTQHSTFTLSNIEF